MLNTILLLFYLMINKVINARLYPVFYYVDRFTVYLRLCLIKEYALYYLKNSITSE
ncbi:hypothetical protein A1OE_937 [Candidatus Endolissoclinum faulkneri L2]|uniref:Uncharacterized protein n=1 Tax=Candidatus Endolissoclinum faulkneri L2 TaxID=1193729 RepID=K7YHQ6_9PROT|nr:hypothetical protein A1OE_937 [Candidatus Endolissoclinum faulkneri L2]